MPPPFSLALPIGPQLSGSAQSTPVLPLTGLTILTVEDSRYASEALRLMCQRSGARLRRTDTIAAARRHLAVYRPDVIIIDMGLPDGSGADLIADLRRDALFFGLILGSSGDPDMRANAMRAGAADFLEKPVDSLATFVATILDCALPAPFDPQTGGDHVLPDPLALQDDIHRAANLISEGSSAARPYVTNFVRSIARSSHDPRLEEAARLAMDQTGGMENLAMALSRRLHRGPGPFATSPAKL